MDMATVGVSYGCDVGVVAVIVVVLSRCSVMFHTKSFAVVGLDGSVSSISAATFLHVMYVSVCTLTRYSMCLLYDSPVYLHVFHFPYLPMVLN